MVFIVHMFVTRFSVTVMIHNPKVNCQTAVHKTLTQLLLVDTNKGSAKSTPE